MLGKKMVEGKVNAPYDADSHKVELVLDGDPRCDPKLRRAADKANDAEFEQEKARILSEP